FRGKPAQRGDGGLNLSLHALLHHGEKELPHIVRGGEEVAAVAHLMRRLYQLPVLQLPQGVAHVGACYGERFCDILGGERLRRKVQQRVHLRNGAIHTPSAAHFAPVKYELSGRLSQDHNHSLRYCTSSIHSNCKYREVGVAPTCRVARNPRRRPIGVASRTPAEASPTKKHI